MIMMTGLSGAGKTTLAVAVQKALADQLINAEVIDADVFRLQNHNTDFSEEGRRRNNRAIAAQAYKKKNAGIVTIIAAINPFEDLRKEIASESGARIVWVKCDLSVLIERDTKGLYKKALLPDDHPEKLTDLTGVNHRYDIPEAPDLVIDTAHTTIAAGTKLLVDFVLDEMKLLTA